MGPRVKYTGIIRDDAGNVYPSVIVFIYLSGTTTTATIYDAVDAVSPAGNITTNTSGQYTFYVDLFDYDYTQRFKIYMPASINTSQRTVTYDSAWSSDIVEGTYAISADKTVSTYVRVPKGVTFAVATGKTLTFTGGFEAGAYQVFSGAGTVSFAGSGTHKVYAEWWGATRDGSTDDATALQAALTAAEGRTLELLAGTYASSTDLEVPDNDTTIRGFFPSCLLFTGATDGVVLPDIYATAGYAIEHVILDNFEIRTSNASGGKAILCDFTDYGSGYHTFKNITVTESGDGHWEYGLYGINFQSSNIYSLTLFQCFTTGIYLGDDCNALRFFGTEIDGGVVACGASRGIDIANTASSADTQWFGGTIQSYFADSCIRVNPGTPRFYGFHIENTNASPADGADIVLASDATTQKASFISCQGGSYLSTAQAYKVVIADSETDGITWSATSQYNTVRDCKVSGTYTDSGYLNRRLGCVDSSGEGLADLLGLHVAFDADDATPSVAKGNMFHTYNGNSTTITDFDGGAEGQKIIVLIQDAKTTVDFTGTNLYGNAGVDWSPTTNDWMEAFYYGGKWYCTVHDCTA